MPRVKTDKEKNPLDYFSGPGAHIRDRIIIHEHPDIPKEGLFVSLNGYPFLAHPGEEVDIPRPVRKMLDTRIVTITRQDDEGKEHTKDIKRVNYTIIKEAVNVPTEGDAMPEV